MNIASVPCRCGHNCAWLAAGRSSGSLDDRLQDRGRVESLDPVNLAEHGCHDRLRLGSVRRARDVRENAAGLERCESGREQFGLQRPEPRDVTRLLAPARLWSTPQRAEPRARRVEQDAVEQPGV